MMPLKNESWRLQMIQAAHTWDYMSPLDSVSWRLCVRKKGGGRTIKASISPLYYVPACASSLMQPPCPPNVTHTHANAHKTHAQKAGKAGAYTLARTHTAERVFCSSQKVLLRSHFKWNEKMLFPRGYFVIFFVFLSFFVGGFTRTESIWSTIRLSRQRRWVIRR